MVVKKKHNFSSKKTSVKRGLGKNKEKTGTPFTKNTKTKRN